MAGGITDATEIYEVCEEWWESQNEEAFRA